MQLGGHSSRTGGNLANLAGGHLDPFYAAGGSEQGGPKQSGPRAKALQPEAVTAAAEGHLGHLLEDHVDIFC